MLSVSPALFDIASIQQGSEFFFRQNPFSRLIIALDESLKLRERFDFVFGMVQGCAECDEISLEAAFSFRFPSLVVPDMVEQSLIVCPRQIGNANRTQNALDV